MSLVVGSRLGPYQVLALLGAGGMGEVYRARDTKLNRDVALKILPDSFAHDADRLARFTREAQTLASLNHPNIAHIYGLEESIPSAVRPAHGRPEPTRGTAGSGQAAVRAIVMELVEGEDLSQRIARHSTGAHGVPSNVEGRGAIPLDEALPIAKQIAEALEAAHEHGIIHRDLKPANIKVRADGSVKVLDFGLAKAIEGADGAGVQGAGVRGAGVRGAGVQGAEGAENSPTMPVHATEPGMILGTAAYMSPEQAKGRTVDRRADVWAFGAVLYEMLTGQRVFAGEDVSDTRANVLKTEPAWERLPADVPARIRQVLRGCLQKDPKHRMHDIADVRLALEGAFETTAPQTTASATSSPPRGRRALIAALAVAAVVIAALAVPAVQHLRETPPPEPRVMRFTIPVPDGVTLPFFPMISPDGTRVVFDGGGALFVRPLDALAAERLPATEGAQAPFWSPDSKSIGFFADAKLKKIDIAGGPAVTICDAQTGGGGAWSPRGVIVFAPNGTSGLLQVSAEGGTPAPATILDPATQATSHLWPQFLPDGEHFLYLSLAAQGNGVFVTSLGSPTSTLLVSTDTQAEYAPPGALVYLRGTTLIRQPFDAAGLRLTGDPTPVAEDIGLSVYNVPGNASFSLSHTGVLVYATRQARMNHRLVWVDRLGGVTPLALAPGAYDSPALSPDGQYVVFSVADPTGSHIWVYDIARGTLGKRTFDGADDAFPIWTRDGTFLTFTRGAGNIGPLMRVRADGSGTAEPLVTDVQLPGLKLAGSWSADGRLLTIQSGNDVIVRDANGALHPTLTTSALEFEARFAPDGRSLVYTSDATGRSEVYVQSYPPGGGKWQISTEGGSQAMWAPNGRELFYRRRGNRMMVVDVELGAAFKASTPRVLFEMPLSESTPNDPARFSVTQDAQRFLVLTPATDQQAAAPSLTVVLNWAQALKR